MEPTKLINPAFDILPEEFDDLSVASYTMRSYSADGQIVNGTDNISSLAIKVDSTNDWVKMSEATLEIRAKILKLADGTAMNTTEVVTVASNIQSIFQFISCSASQVPLHTIQNPGHSSTVRNLMNMSRDFAENVAQNEGFWPEHAATQYGESGSLLNDTTLVTTRSGAASVIKYNVDAVTATVYNDYVGYNESYRQRWEQTNTSQEFRLMVPLARIFPFFEAYQSVTRGIEYDFTFNKQLSYANCLHGIFGAPLGKLLITDLRLWVPSLLPSVSALNYLENQLAQDAAAKIRYEHWEAHMSPNFDNQVTNPEFRGVRTFDRPLYAFVGFQYQSQYTAQNDTDPSIFAQTDSANPLQYVSATGGAVGLSDIYNVSLMVGGRKFPLIDFQSNFAADDYNRAYGEFLRVTGASPFDYDGGSIVTHRDYRWQYCLHAFDLRPLTHEKGSSYDIEVNALIEAGSSSSYRMVLILCTEKTRIVGTRDGRMYISQ